MRALKAVPQRFQAFKFESDLGSMERIEHASGRQHLLFIYEAPMASITCILTMRSACAGGSRFAVTWGVITKLIA